MLNNQADIKELENLVTKMEHYESLENSRYFKEFMSDYEQEVLRASELLNSSNAEMRDAGKRIIAGYGALKQQLLTTKQIGLIAKQQLKDLEEEPVEQEDENVVSINTSYEA